MKISGVEIQTSGHIRNLGVIMDASLTFSDHVSKLVRTSYYHLRQLRGIRRSLTTDSTDSCHSLVRALVHSRIDYCNGLMSGVSLQLLDQLDGVMRAAARLILLLPRMSFITNHLPCDSDCTGWTSAAASDSNSAFVYRCLDGTAPVYICLGTLCLFHPLLDGIISGLRRRDYSVFQLRRLSLGHDHSQFRAHRLGTHFHSTYDAPTRVS